MYVRQIHLLERGLWSTGDAATVKVRPTVTRVIQLQAVIQHVQVFFFFLLLLLFVLIAIFWHPTMIIIQLQALEIQIGAYHVHPVFLMRFLLFASYQTPINDKAMFVKLAKMARNNCYRDLFFSTT